MTFHGVVIGSPISHSLSPLIHTSAYNFLGFDGTFVKEEVREDQLIEFIKDFLFKSDKYQGVALTAPLKEKLIEISSSLDIDVSENALIIGSANTLINRDNELNAFSTDYYALLRILEKANLGKKLALFGAGGTSRAILGALDTLVDNKIVRSDLQIDIYNRTSKRAVALAENFSNLDCEAISLNLDDANNSKEIMETLATTSSIINTLPPESYFTSGKPSELSKLLHSILESSKLKDLNYFFDVIYAPYHSIWLQTLPGKIQKNNGLDLLLEQALDQIRIFTQMEFSLDELREPLRKILHSAN